jgi:ABC transport system ATP-binding/permease protein
MEFVVNQVHSHDTTSMAETPGEARRLLKQFEFPRNRWNEPISVLSGGERRRLQLLSVLTKVCSVVQEFRACFSLASSIKFYPASPQKPNFLILDEPSVDCDLDTLSAMEAFLEQFQGVLLTVSHDRAFADKVTDHLFVFEGDGLVKDFGGTLSEYASCLVELENQKIQQVTNPDDSDDGKKQQYKEDRDKRNEERNFVRSGKKEMLNLERALEKLKTKANDVLAEIHGTSNEVGWSTLADLTNKLDSLNEEINEKETKWLEIGEMVELLNSEYV